MSTLVAGAKPASLITLLSFFGLQSLTAGTVTAATASSYRFALGTITVEFTGSFTYSADGHLSGGTVTGWNYSDSGALSVNAFKVTGFSLPVATFLTQLNTNDTSGFLTAIFGGNDTMTGSAFADFLLGDTGDDKLSGGAGDDFLGDGAGSDTLIGGKGNDIYSLVDGTNTLVELAGQGIDTVLTDVDFDLAVSGANIENLELTGAASKGSGNNLDNEITGNVGNDTLQGAAGDDSLLGGKGADSMDGGAGDDAYEIDDVNDTVNDSGIGGDDLILSSIDMQLGQPKNQGVEHLILLNGAKAGTGDAQNNLIIGNDAGNTLDGQGGQDSLIAGAGDDTYFVDDTGDMIAEAAGQGLDVVRSSVSFTLSANLENLELTSAAAVTGIGNAGGNKISDTSGLSIGNKLLGLACDDILAGNSGNDTLDGGAGNDQLSGGADGDSLTGGAGNDTLSGLTGNDTVAGGLGNDHYVVDDQNDKIVEVAGQGTDLVVSSVDILALADNVENLTLQSGATVGTGNKLNNFITGSTTADSLDGGLGNDTLSGGLGIDSTAGGLGNDVYEVDDLLDQTTESAKGGTDTVRSFAVNYTLGAEVENLALMTGAAGGKGNSLGNFITGNNADNVLEGLGGADTLIGGKGNDQYIVEDVKDIVVEAAGQGVDIVQARVDYKLGANSDALWLLAGAIVGTGNAGDNLITDVSFAATNNRMSGLAGNDNISGAFGNDTLDGGLGQDSLSGNADNDSLAGGDGNDTLSGDAGADSLAGGKGNDTYLAYDGVDKITEFLNQGTDTLESLISVATLFDNFENLTLVGSAMQGGGNALNNVITGTGGVDTLNGGAGNDTLTGGAGADQMAGGIGNDTYDVDNAGDVITEKSKEGTDTVRSSIDFNLGVDAPEVENLQLLTGAFKGTGSAGNNVITGNGDNNTLDGGGGVDMLIGGKGDDFYLIDSKTDKLVELANQGDDTVKSSVDHVLAANIEQLELDVGALNGTGNAGGNILKGNGAANKLLGLAGGDEIFGDAGDDTVDGGADGDFLHGDAGNDSLIGGAGKDALDGGKDADRMAGGAGDDGYLVDDAKDVVLELAGQGVDFIYSSVDIAALADNVENLKLTSKANSIGNGNAVANKIESDIGNDSLSGAGGNDTLVGNDGDDTLDGGAGNDYLFGLVGNDDIAGGAGNDTLLGGQGSDTLNGGVGDDLYYIGANPVVIVETSGIDTIRAFVDFDLSASKATADIENLILNDVTANGTGNGLANVITGNGAANKLSGLDGKDNLIGDAGDDSLDGGSGADTMAGGNDNDEYTVDQLADKVVEFGGVAGGVADHVFTLVDNYVLAANVERLTLSGPSLIAGSGNALDNAIQGNSIGNKLLGLAGNDYLAGDDGADSLDGGVGNDNLAGGAGGDSLLGGAGNDTLDGGGSADTMAGGLGDDLYIVDDVGESLAIAEAANQGIDTVQAQVTGASLGANIENLELVGSGAINGTGNGLNNRLTDFNGDATLFGGLGNDTLVGGEGSDRFNGGTGQDRFVVTGVITTATAISDFQAGVNGDTLDVASLLTGYLDGLDDPNDFVQFIAAGGNTRVLVDADGAANGVSFVDVALLENVTLTNVSQAIVEGNLDLT